MSTKNSSAFEWLTGKPVNIVWMLRGFAIAALGVLLLALLVFKTGNAHSFCIGLAVGTLIGHIAQLSSIKSVEIKDTTRPADVDNIFVTR